MKISCIDIGGTYIKSGVLEDGMLLELRLPCSVNGSTNPALLQEALKRHLGLEPYGAITRKCLLLQDFSPLR